MNGRREIARYLTIFGLCAPVAVAVWLIFHAINVDLSETSKAVGYVDSGTAMGIALGYIAMIGGTLVFAGIALWAALRAISLWITERKKAG